MSDPAPSDACPDCGVDVAQAEDRCPACGAVLDAERFVTVLETADPGLLALVRSALEARGVPVVVQGEGALGLFPLGSLATGLTHNLFAATIHVPRRHAAEALELIRGTAHLELSEDAEPSEGAESTDEVGPEG